MEERLAQLEAEMAELRRENSERNVQQIKYPLDDISRTILGTGLTSSGLGATDTTQTIAIASTPASIDVPAAYEGTILILSDGATYEIPYLAVT
jgi:hypothetical protein